MKLVISSIQKAAIDQRKINDKVIRSYRVLKKNDPKLKDFEPLTFPYSLRNYEKREEFARILADLQGNREHLIVKEAKGKVSIWVRNYMLEQRTEGRTEEAQRLLDFHFFLLGRNYHSQKND